MMARGPSLARSDGQLLATAVFVVGLTYVVVVTASMGRLSYDTWAGLWIVPLLFGGSLLLLRRLRPCVGSASLVPLLSLALVARGIGTAVRYFVIFSVYDGRADASTYHTYGTSIAEHYRQGNFDVDLGAGSASTHFMKTVTGVVYTVVGPSKIGGFAVFGAAAFWGCYLMLRAFQLAVPGGDVKRYAVLIFFLPSMLFWPSSVGKEAWMMLAIGCTVYGAARLFTHRRGAMLPLLLGLAASLTVRPHIAVVLVVALCVGYLVRPRAKGILGGRIGKIAGVVTLTLVGVFAAQQMQDSLNLDSSSSVNEALDFAEERTNEGGSSFAAARIRSPIDIPWATVTVLFRPFPQEADNAQMAVSAIEGIGLMLLFVASMRRIGRAPRMALHHPYVAFAMLYSFIFVYAFSTFGNFGIITRQRVQLLPLVLVLLCLLPASRLPKSMASGRVALSAR